MTRKKELIFLIFSDFLFVNLAYSAYYYFRIESHLIKFANPTEYLTPMLVIFFYWFLLFSTSGLYAHWFVRSRFDEFISVIKAISFGCIILFFAIFIDDFLNDAPVISRFLILIYWLVLVVFVSFGRVFIRGFQMRLFNKGIGVRNAVIVGSGKSANELFEMIRKYPKLGYRFIGYIGLEGELQTENELGKITDLKNIISKEKIEVVLVASAQKIKNLLLDTLNYCVDEKVEVKIMPEMYEIISGMAKTQQIYGLPLIEVKTELLTLPQRIVKRVIDIFMSFFILIIMSPILLITSILIKLTSKGPVFYIQERVGKDGKNFYLFKFRSMIPDAELDSGPAWADLNDPRVTPFGRFLRRTRLDEVPQFINVLKNDMSVVGPRPERPFFVDQLKKEIPYYSKRIRIKPGITGWAQVKHTYDSSLDDVKEKLQYDFYYIENMSLNLDFKIIVNTIIVVFTMKGH